MKKCAKRVYPAGLCIFYVYYSVKVLYCTHRIFQNPILQWLSEKISSEVHILGLRHSHTCFFDTLFSWECPFKGHFCDKFSVLAKLIQTATSGAGSRFRSRIINRTDFGRLTKSDRHADQIFRIRNTVGLSEKLRRNNQLFLWNISVVSYLSRSEGWKNVASVLKNVCIITIKKAVMHTCIQQTFKLQSFIYLIVNLIFSGASSPCDTTS
jgi:hypothetical protein